jgi:hypothetical protein
MQNMPLKNAWLVKLAYHLADLINKTRYRTRSYPSKNCDIHIVEIQRFDEAFTVFWEQVSRHYSFIVERSIEYLNWRYSDPRSGDFLIRKAVDPEGNVLGYVVFMVNRLREDYPIGYIVDLLTLPDRLEVAYSLITEAMHYFDEHDVNIVNYLTVENHPYVEILGRHGFLDSRIKLEIFFDEHEKVEALRNLRAHSPTNIHFSFGDIDSLPSSLV